MKKKPPKKGGAGILFQDTGNYEKNFITKYVGNIFF